MVVIRKDQAAVVWDLLIHQYMRASSLIGKMWIVIATRVLDTTTTTGLSLGQIERRW